MPSERTVTVLDPSGHVFQEDVGLARRLDDLAGQKVGLLDDGLAFSDAFLERIGELLEERAGVGAVISLQKPNLSAPRAEADDRGAGERGGLRRRRGGWLRLVLVVLYARRSHARGRGHPHRGDH